MGACHVLLAYLSPETLLPATSILATIAGVVMMACSRSMRLVCRWLGRAVARTRSRTAIPSPHFRARGANESSASGLGLEVQASDASGGNES